MVPRPHLLNRVPPNEGPSSTRSKKRGDREGNDMEKTRKNEGAKRTKDVKCNSIVWHDLSQRECVGSDQVHTTRLKTRKQMCRSATVSSLCTIQHSPSAWAGFAPKLTETLTVAVTKSCSQIPLERVCAVEQQDTIVQVLASAIVTLRDGKICRGPVQRKRSAPTVTTFP